MCCLGMLSVRVRTTTRYFPCRNTLCHSQHMARSQFALHTSLMPAHVFAAVQVKDFCTHSLALDCKAITLETTVQFAAWIASHSHLVGSLSWAMPPEPQTTLLESQAAIADALQQAAAAPNGLQLQHYHSSCPSGPILSALPGQHLTSLGFTFHPEYDSISATTSVLAGLTNLRTLSMHGRDVGSLLSRQALHQLSRLTMLELRMIRDVADLQQLPGSLQLKQLQLTAVAPRWQVRQQLLLGQLTSLQELQVQHPRYPALPDEPLVLQPGDVLPLCLTKLVVGDCESAVPLLPLQQLRVLSMEDSSMPAEQLLQVSRVLKCLSELHLGYTVPGSADYAAAAWSSSLPVASLAIESCGLCGYSARQLAQLGGSLTALDLYDCRPLGCTGQQFAAVLQQLQQLQRLVLSSVQLLEEDFSTGESAAGRSSSRSSRSSKSSLELSGSDGCCTCCCTSDSSSSSDSTTSSFSLVACGASVTSISDSCSEVCSTSWVNCSGLQAVTRAIGGLHKLHSLCIERLLGLSRAEPFDQQHVLALDAAAVQQLAAATQLTQLTLAACGLTDAAVAAVAGGLPVLQELVLDGNPGVTDGAVAAIGQLQQLKFLSLNGTSVTDGGMAHLARLKHLQGLSVCDTAVTADQACRACAVAAGGSGEVKRP